MLRVLPHCSTRVGTTQLRISSNKTSIATTSHSRTCYVRCPYNATGARTSLRMHFACKACLHPRLRQLFRIPKFNEGFRGCCRGFQWMMELMRSTVNLRGRAVWGLSMRSQEIMFFLFDNYLFPSMWNMNIIACHHLNCYVPIVYVIMICM